VLPGIRGRPPKPLDIDLLIRKGWDMELYLVQHGEAKPEAEDPERSLTERGIEAVRWMAAWAARSGVQVGQIRHSGKRRAEQTAALMGERLNPPKGVIVAEGLKPNDDPRPLAEALRSEHESLMLVGHLPYLGRLASLLVVGDPEGGIIRFQQAGIVCLDRQEGKWGVRWVMSPALLGSFEAVRPG
jgi:phosphohistidine phosphatase